jgi:hypothetical protein
MRRLAGQAALGAGRVLHAVLSIALGMAVIVTIGAGALIWRLSQGPIDLAWLTPRLDALLNADAGPARVHVRSVALAWEGWRKGVDRPVDLRLGGLVATDVNGAPLAQIPRVELSLSFGWLLVGRIVPRAVEIDSAHVHLERAQDGSLSLNFGRDPDAPDAGETKGGPFAGLLAELTRPSRSDRSQGTEPSPRWSQLRRVRISNADFAMADRRLGTVWRASRADLDLQRRRQGGVTGSANLTVMVGDQPVHLAAEATLPANGSGARIQGRFGQVEPAAMASAVPALGPLEALHAPVQGTFHLNLGAGFAWRDGALQAELGQGFVRAGQGSVPILGATLNVDGDLDHAHLRQLRLILAGPNGAGPIVQAHGEVVRKDHHLVGAMEADLDQVPFADLARYWPVGASTGARNWVTRNVTAGTARAAHVALTLQTAEDGSDIELNGVSGHISGDDLTINWLRPLPPVEHVKAELALLSPDALVITTQGGRQAGTAQGGILLRGGSIKITGMMEKDQYAAIEQDMVGSVADSLGLLRQPRLHLLDRHPIDLRNPTGQVMNKLSVNLWLDERVTIDAISIHAVGQLSGLHLGGVLAGRDLDNGLLDLDVDNDALRLDGTGELAGIPSDLAIQMDFRAGPPAQVLRRYTVSATTNVEQLAHLGVDPGGVVAGPLNVQATVLERRNGTGQADLQADLGQAELAVAPLGWRKARGQSANCTARVLLNRDRIVGIDQIAMQGDGVSLGGAVDYAAGQPERVRLSRLVLGDTRGEGEVRLSAGSGQPLRATFTGTSLDLSARLAEHAPRKPATSSDAASETPWVADLQVGRVMLGQNRMLSDVSAHAESDGRLVRQARVGGRTGGTDRFSATIVPEGPTAREVTVDAADAGALLRAFSVLGTLDGGTLALVARYDDSVSTHPLAGTAEITSFRLRDAPAAARVLQAMTLYGLVASLRGPGIGVSRLIAPFRLDGDVLELDDARAFSPSLGFTARGRIDLARRVADVQGTIVPAYFFNSILGRIPVLGTLFSPEKGGGVFSATYKVHGRFDDPAVTVNPLAALTPGFLRGVFGIFTGGARAADPGSLSPSSPH